MKKCFNCKQNLFLIEFKEDKRKYQVPADMGRCKVCKECILKRALVNLEVFEFSYEDNDFVTKKFTTKEEVINYLKLT
jgi:hypothetical protein